MNPEYAVELRAREPIFHHPELGTDRASFEAQTAADYWEVGASGNVYRRDYIWEVLADRYAADEDDPWEIDDFACRPVADTTRHVPAAPRASAGAAARRCGGVPALAGRLFTIREHWSALTSRNLLTG